MTKRNLVPALLNEKDVTTDWIEEILPEYGTGIAFESNSHCNRATFFRYGVCWTATWVSNDSSVVITPMVPFGRTMTDGYFNAHMELFCKTIREDLIMEGELECKVETMNNNIVISFYWDMDKINK